MLRWWASTWPTMPISPHLLRKLHETLGAEAAEDLASRLEAMDANRGDIGELRHEMQLGFTRVDARFASLEAKFDQKSATLEAKFDQRFATLEAKFDQKFATLEAKFVTFDERFEK